MIIQLDFPHTFAVEELAAITPTTRRIPPAPEDVDSVIVQFTPAAAPPWTAAFAKGFIGSDLISGIYGWPDGESVAVVAAGYGYVVHANDPAAPWVRLQPMPITDVRVLIEHQLIVCTDFTHMFAYNGKQSVWKSERLSWDGITVTQVGANHIFGLAWDAMQDKEVEFALDVRNGEHTGGARPWSRK